MSRSLPFSLDKKMQIGNRRPGYRVLLYDIRTTGETVGDVVREVTLDPLAGPLDVTDHVLAVDVSEVAGDFVSSGIPSSKVTITVVDDTPGNVVSIWDPQFSADELAAPARFLRRDNVLRLYEGDLDVAEADWPLTFTGVLVGQAGVDRGRAIDPQGRSTLSMSAVSRDAEFVNQSRTSEEFQRGAAYLTMGDEVAQKLMGLDFDEINFFGWGSQTTGLQMQFVKQSPLVTIAQLMFVDGFLPRFTGEGKLTQTSGSISKSPARIYTNLETIRHIGKPFSELDPVNSVEVIGIEGQKTEVIQQRQPLAQVSLTTGFFTSDEEVFVYWSEDRTQLARNIKLDIQKSVNGGLSALGGGETFDLILAENQAQISVGLILRLSTGFAPYIIVFLTVVYVVLAAIPDLIVGFISGTTISVGRLLQAAALAGILILMTKIGRGQYEAIGDPLEFVYKEIRAIAEIAGLTAEQLSRVTIENHLVQNQSDADDSARVVLFRQQARGNPRTVTALHDLRLEPDDIFEIPGGRRFLIETIRRRLIRNAAEILANYGTFEVTPGLEP